MSAVWSVGGSEDRDLTEMETGRAGGGTRGGRGGRRQVPDCTSLQGCRLLAFERSL